MPDGLVRLHHSGQAHFLTFSCFHRLPLLAQMRMEDGFLCALEQVRRRFRMCVFGYVVMPEHVHLLVNEPALRTIADALQLLKTKVSVQARKEQKRRAGDEPFWQARYFDHNVRNHAGFVTQLRYIHRNPVKRGLCSAPEDWPWSSFRAWASGEIGPVEIENEWTAMRREASQRVWSPALSAERSGKDGARRF
jgi:putative transposase